MKTLLQVFLSLLAGGVAAAVVVSCCLTLLFHFEQGSKSPGILAIAEDGLQSWIPIVFFLVAVWFVITCARVLLVARRRSSSAEMSMLKYLDLTLEQKRVLLKREHEKHT